MMHLLLLQLLVDCTDIKLVLTGQEKGSIIS